MKFLYALIIAVSVFACNSTNNNENIAFDATADIEAEFPASYIHVEGNYKQNFLGNKQVVSGELRSSATKVIYKNVVLKVVYYGKTNTQLGSNLHTISKVLQPLAVIPFDFKADNYQDVDSIGIKIQSATVK